MASSPSRSRKSDRTRASILAAAEKLFASLGYERTTVREIATRAAIDPAMVIRYFGSKDALFAEVAKFDLNLPDLGRIDRDSMGETLVSHYLGLWEGKHANAGLQILLRSAASNDYAASKMRGMFAAQVLPAIARVGSRSTAAERAGLVASQLLGMALCRYVLKLPPIASMKPKTIVKEVGATVQRYATGM